MWVTLAWWVVYDVMGNGNSTRALSLSQCLGPVAGSYHIVTVCTMIIQVLINVLSKYIYDHHEHYTYVIQQRHAM